jgi:putative flippase GtrA
VFNGSRFCSLKEKNLAAVYIRWGIVGLTTLLLDVVIFRILFKITNSIVLSNACSMSLSGTFNYLSHKRWTFPSQKKVIILHKYVVVMFAMFVANTTSIHILVALKLGASIGKVLSIALLAPLSFSLLRKFVFSNSNL